MAIKNVKVTGTIERIVRTVSKQFAEVTLMVPTKEASEIPMGTVIINIEQKQPEMFDDKKAFEGVESKKAKVKKNVK